MPVNDDARPRDDDSDERKAAYATKMIAAQKALTGRDCGDCALCCKLLNIDVPELKKTHNVWCQHCRPGKGGCSIYEARPPICRGFACEWLINPEFSEAWKPSRCKIVIHQNRSTGKLLYTFDVDPTVPERWREPPYYAAIKKVARNGLDGSLEEQFPTYVQIGKRKLVVLPDKEVDVTGRAHIVIPIAADKWDVIHFESNADSRRFAAKATEFMERFRALPPDQQDRIRAELIARRGTRS